MFRRFLGIGMSLALGSAASASSLNVRDLGAAGDGRSNDRATLQKAVDLCAGSGGGEVLVPPGTYLTGEIDLKSGVTLVLSAGATLQASGRREDYGADHGENRADLIVAEGASNI